ncbi:transposable element Tcb2 transposase [Trichonephila clavipes]|nr:transposable element Tcb2 transposase [Trichonephila clavipes]
MTAQWYVHDILQPHVLPLIQRLPGAIFQLNNARPHTAWMSQDCLCTVTTLSWPVRCPYLSPIKHIWVNLGRLVGHPTSLNELEQRISNCGAPPLERRDNSTRRQIEKFKTKDYSEHY